MLILQSFFFFLQSEMEELAKAEQELKTGQFLEQEGHPITSKYSKKAILCHSDLNMIYHGGDSTLHPHQNIWQKKDTAFWMCVRVRI